MQSGNAASPVLVDGWIVAMVRPKDCVFHRVASPVCFFGFGVSKVGSILPRIQVFKEGIVAPHGLDDEDWAFWTTHV